MCEAALVVSVGTHTVELGGSAGWQVCVPAAGMAEGRKKEQRQTGADPLGFEQRHSYPTYVPYPEETRWCVSVHGANRVISELKHHRHSSWTFATTTPCQAISTHIPR